MTFSTVTGYPGPTPPGSSSPSVVTYPPDLFTSTGTATPNAAIGGTTVTVVPGTVLTNSSSGFYTQIQMVPANTVLIGVTGVGGALTTGSFSSGVANPSTGATPSIYLPLPFKINDYEVHGWADLSFTDMIPIIGDLLNLGNLTSRAFGQATSVNPFLYMLYKQPIFRDFEFSWSFSPQNSAETQTLSQIITYFKTAALPD